MPQIEQFCQKWQVIEFALFGSVLRDDFDPNSSDIDVIDLHIVWDVVQNEMIELRETLKPLLSSDEQLSIFKSDVNLDNSSKE